MDTIADIEARYREIIQTFETAHVTERTGFYLAVMDIKCLLAAIDADRALLRELHRVVWAGQFGIPEEESIRLRQAITERIGPRSAAAGDVPY